MHESGSEVAQSRLTLSGPMDSSLPDSSVLGSFQARVLEWGAIAFSVFSLQNSFKKKFAFMLNVHKLLSNPKSNL